jgi:glycosyltransferase involved in cell wall biosynthesis
VTYVTYFFGKTWFRIVNPFMALIYWIMPGIILRFGGHNIVCPSGAVAKNLQSHTNAEVMVIPSPLDRDEIDCVRQSGDTGGLRAELGIPDDVQLLSYVGRLSPEKDVDGLLRVLRGLSVDFKLVIVGDGPEKIKLERLTRELNLNGHVTFLGQKNHKETLAVMKSCDVLILPSRTEVFPTVVLEALAMGRPVIATKVGGIAEVESANLYLIDSIEEIKEVLPRVKPKPDRDILDDYSLDKICGHFESIFSKLI